MFNFFLVVFIIGIVVIALVTLAALLFAAMTFIAVAAILAVVAWRIATHGRARRKPRAIPSKSPIDRLTDWYVSGKIDIYEFERKVAALLHHQAP